ncbi:TolC family protein [Pirellulaceae bacterium SH501]
MRPPLANESKSSSNNETLGPRTDHFDPNSNEQTFRVSEQQDSNPLRLVSSSKELPEDFASVKAAKPPSLVVGDFSAVAEGVSMGSQPRSLSIEDAKTWALQNSDVIRRDAEFLSPALAQNIESISTVLDYEIAKSGFLFGQRGVAAALSDFDWRWANQIGIGEDEVIQNNRFLSGGIPPGGTLNTRNGLYGVNLVKNTSTGGQIRLAHELNYLASNVQDAFYPSSFSGRIRGEMRQPIMAGAGKQVTSITGPLNGALDGVTGVSQGVLIARIQTQEARENLNMAVAMLLRDTEQLYHQAASSKDIIAEYNGAISRIDEIAEQVKANIASGTSGGIGDLLSIMKVKDELQILRLEEQRILSSHEIRLTRLIGEPVSANDLVFLTSSPVVEFIPDIDNAWATAIQSRPDFRLLELRERSYRLQLVAARNLDRPQLDLVAGYNVNGFGDQMLAEDVPGPDQSTASFYRNLFDAENTGWDARLELTSVAGRRFAKTRLRNIALNMRRLAVLRSDRETELSLELRQTANEIDYIYHAYQLRIQQLERSRAIYQSLQARQLAEFRIDNAVQLASTIREIASTNVDIRKSQAEYQRAICEYAYRQGKTLVESGILIQ